MNARTADMVAEFRPWHESRAGQAIDTPADDRASALDDAPIHIAMRGVSKVYSDGDRQVAALRDIDLSVKRGEVFGVIGRSGAGKSSLIRLINGLEPMTGGQVRIDDIDIGTLRTRDLMRLRRRIGMIFQHFNLLSSRRVIDNLALPARAAGMGRALIRHRALELLDLVGLADKRDAYPAQLSGGQKQRVGIARALMLEPEILLCDEATSALDPETTDAVLALLRRINRQLGLTIVLITHEMAVTRAICDRVAVLENGEAVEQGPVWQIFGRPSHPATRAMLAPLADTLPSDLGDAIRPEPAGAHDWHVVALNFPGESSRNAPPDLAAIGQALNAPVHWLHGGIERIQGRAVGRIVVGIENAIGREHAVRDRLAHVAGEVTEVGYVRLSGT